jgi:cysteinyl-tRNA synthetase
MDDDLDTPRATALVFDLVRRANALLADGDAEAAAPLAAAVLEITSALGLELGGEGGEVPEAIRELARQRDEGRAAKDWARADALRDRIVAAGYVVEDTPAGTQVRPA